MPTVNLSVMKILIIANFKISAFSAISGQGAAIRSWVRSGDLDKLESVILEGQGARLLGLMESSNDPKVRAFLKSVPSYMAKVDLIHDAGM